MKGLALIFTVAFSTIAAHTDAATNPAANTYWVVESAKNSRIVRIYNSNHELIKQLPVEKKIDITRKKHRKYLDSLLAVTECNK